MKTNTGKNIIIVQLMAVALLVAIAVGMLGASIDTWGRYGRFQSSYMYDPMHFRSLIPTEMTPGMVKVTLSVVIVSIIIVVLGARQVVVDRAIFYNSYWDLFGGLVIFIIPWAILNMYNSSHHLTGLDMSLRTIAGQAQFGMYWAITLIVSIIYNSIQVIRHNSVDFECDTTIIASIFIFMARIVLGYVWPVFFLIIAMPGSGKQKDESYADYQIRSTINLAEKLALTGLAMFGLNKLVNGLHMRYIRGLDNELAAALDMSKEYRPGEMDAKN